MKIINATDEYLEFGNGIKIENYHYQECCEHVYADFTALKDEAGQYEFAEDIKIEKVKGYGFRIEGFFIPCYNSQNGYYGSDLKLVISKYDKKIKEIDISDCCLDDIY